MANARQFHWDEVVPYGDAKADRRLIAGDAGDFKRVCVKAGFVAARHEHAFEQFFMMAEGEGVLLCADGEVLLRPGVVIHFDAGVWHEARFDTDAVVYEVNFEVRCDGLSMGADSEIYRTTRAGALLRLDEGADRRRRG